MCFLGQSPAPAGGIGHDLPTERPDNEIAADCRRVVYRLHCGVRIVDCRRQGLESDVDLLSDTERDVLLQWSLKTDPTLASIASSTAVDSRDLRVIAEMAEDGHARFEHIPFHQVVKV